MVGYLFIHLTCSLEEPPPRLQRHLRVVTELHTVCKRVVRCFLPQRSCKGYVFTGVYDSVNRGGEGVPGPRRGVHGPGVGCLVLGGVWLWGGAWSRGRVPGPRGGVPGPGGLVFQHALRQTPLRETATAADGTHPTGMHSYSN